MLEFIYWASHSSRRGFLYRKTPLPVCSEFPQLGMQVWQAQVPQFPWHSEGACRARWGKVHGGDGLLCFKRQSCFQRENYSWVFKQICKSLEYLSCCTSLPRYWMYVKKIPFKIPRSCFACCSTGFLWSLCMTQFIGWNRYFLMESHLS